MIGPSDALVFGDGNGRTVDMNVFPLHASLALRTTDLGSACHQHFGRTGCDHAVPGGGGVTKVTPRCRVLDPHRHILISAYGLKKDTSQLFLGFF